LESQTGSEKTRKHPANPVIRGDQPREDGVLGTKHTAVSSVIFDKEKGQFRIWYHYAYEYYAHSPDGIHWAKPLLDLVECEGRI
jgi:hypothetical protein